MTSNPKYEAHSLPDRENRPKERMNERDNRKVVILTFESFENERSAFGWRERTLIACLNQI
jgi:hypothetical protein